MQDCVRFAVAAVLSQLLYRCRPVTRCDIIALQHHPSSKQRKIVHREEPSFQPINCDFSELEVLKE